MNPESKLPGFVMNPKTFESGTQSGNNVSEYLEIRIPLKCKILANPNTLNVMNLETFMNQETFALRLV